MAPELFQSIPQFSNHFATVVIVGDSEPPLLRNGVLSEVERPPFASEELSESSPAGNTAAKSLQNALHSEWRRLSGVPLFSLCSPSNVTQIPVHQMSAASQEERRMMRRRVVAAPLPFLKISLVKFSPSPRLAAQAREGLWGG